VGVVPTFLRRRTSAQVGDHESVFTQIMRARAWGDGESLSGAGSGLARTADLRAQLPDLLARLRVRSMLDAGCGDFNWMRAVELPVRRYVGVDVVPELVARLNAEHAGRGRRFLHADITRDRLPRVDLVLCREVLFHFPDGDVRRALANLGARTHATWLLTTSFRQRPENPPIPLGSWRPLNLEAAPFGFPEPLDEIDDLPFVAREEHADKRLCLWRFADLPLR
jgi:SAM-dependent methyltransferase